MIDEEYLTDAIEGIIHMNGRGNQMIVAIEELSELQKELTKQLRLIGDREHLVEELSDVWIVFNEVCCMFHVGEDEIDSVVYEKIDRTLKRLGLHWIIDKHKSS